MQHSDVLHPNDQGLIRMLHQIENDLMSVSHGMEERSVDVRLSNLSSG